MGHRYIGSKTKILHEVVSRIEDLVPPRGRVIDLMSGTAAVSAALRKANFKVTAVDLMTYSFHHARVLLFLSQPPKFTKAYTFIKQHAKSGENAYEKMLSALNSVASKRGYFWREFSPDGAPKNGTKPRKYFSTINAKKIDGIRFWIKKLHEEKKLTDIEHSLLLHDLIMATNDVANISGTYGHHLAKLMGRANDSLLLHPTIFNVKKDSEGHLVLRGYAEKLAPSLSGDLCYIDPPYTKRQYAANYHLLETLAREDAPSAVGVSGLRPWRDQYSDFCTKTKIRSAFDKIFTTMKCKNFLVSYSEDGLIKINDLVKFFSAYGRVDVTTFQNKRFRSNNSKLGKELKEYLIHIKLNDG
jgi:adenine-specific DNA-methyltransferase